MSTKLSLYHTDGEFDAARDIPLWQRWQPPVGLLLNPSAERVAQFHRACPYSLVIPRNHPLSEQHDDMHRDPAGTGVRHARELHEYRLQVAPGVPASQVILLGINEPEANPSKQGGQAVQHIAQYTVARFREHARLGDRGGGPDFGVTWPYYGQWQSYREIKAAAIAYNCVVTCHRYWRGDLGIDHEWRQWAGEWGFGEDVPVIITECGDDGLLFERKGGQPGGWQDALSGLSGPAYMDQLKTWDSRLRPRANILGACVFLSGELSPWNTYNLRPILPAIAEHAEACRAEQPYVPEKPPMEIPESIREKIREAAWNKAGIALNRDSAFFKYAQAQGLGRPVTNEFDTFINGDTVRAQGYGGGIVYAAVGDWGNVRMVGW